MRPTAPACPRCWAQAYKELGLKRGGLTSTAEVRKAYRARVLQDHPDKARPPPAADASTATDGARRTRQRSPPWPPPPPKPQPPLLQVQLPTGGSPRVRAKRQAEAQARFMRAQRAYETIIEARKPPSERGPSITDLQRGASRRTGAARRGAASRSRK